MKRSLKWLVLSAVLVTGGCVSVSGGGRNSAAMKAEGDTPTAAQQQSTRAPGRPSPGTPAQQLRPGSGNENPKTPAGTSDKAASASPAESREALIAKIEETLNDPRFARAHWGVLIQSLKTGEVWYERGADKLYNPASNQKVPTSAAALLGLGPDFRYETVVAHNGEVKDGTLNGDLVVFGQGDPTFYTQWTKDSRASFRQWAATLKEKGITRITGNIIGDDNAWDDTHTGAGWPPIDEVVPWYYAEYSALNFNENYVDIKITPPSAPGGEVKLEPNVPSSYYELVNNIRATAEGPNSVSLDRAVGSNRITLSGTVKAGSSSFEESPTITNPTLFFVTVLKETLEEEGIKVDGKPVDCDDVQGWDKKPGDIPELFVHQSPPLLEILQKLFKRSQNMYSETMIYTLGWKKYGKGTFANGRKAVHEELKKIGIEPDEYMFRDGSGLSRYNYISPRVITKINTYMYNNKELWPMWESIQSVAGVDGTLRNRMKNTRAEGNVKGKTGTIAAVRSLSGYVTTAAGEPIAFSMIVNAHQRGSSDTDSITDTVARLLAEYAVPAGETTSAGN